MFDGRFRSTLVALRTRDARSLSPTSKLDAARLQLDAARAAIGELELPDNQRRLDALSAQL